MRKVDVPIGEKVTLKLGLRGAEHVARVLDATQELILLRVPPELRSTKQVHYVSLEYTADQYALWNVPTTVHSVFEDWWYLKRPEEHRCQCLQRRVFPRVSLDLKMLAIPINQQLQQEGDPFSIVLHDLSASGCRISSEKLMRERTKLVLVLALPGQEGLPVITEVVRAGGYDRGAYQYGLQFQNMRSDHVEAINAYVEGQIEKVIAR